MMLDVTLLFVHDLKKLGADLFVPLHDEREEADH